VTASADTAADTSFCCYIALVDSRTGSCIACVGFRAGGVAEVAGRDVHACS
jgi:hypothetical protein